MKPRLLFHVCCAPCSGLISRRLTEDFAVIAYYDNSNIWPEAEFVKRAQEAEKFFKTEGVEFILAPYDYEDWKILAKNLEDEPEKGGRCKLCYHRRLKSAAEFAKNNQFDYFTTSLVISPYKNAKAINILGRSLAKEYGIKFLMPEFGDEVNYKKTIAFAKNQGFYRQKYCGCEFSLKNGKIKSTLKAKN